MAEKNTATANVKMTPEMLRKLKQVALDRGISYSAIVRRLIESYLKKMGRA